MNVWIDAVVVLLILTNLWLLGSMRLVGCIRTTATQGVLMGLLPLLMHGSELTLRLGLQAGASTALKAVVFPWLLLRAVRGANVRREVEPFIGPAKSIMVGMGLLIAAMWIAGRLPPPMSPTVAMNLVVPAALFTIMVGLFLIVSRRTALAQVLGYLAMENGIYAFGMTFAENQPMLVELGILLDVFMAVFVMGITIYHINREFDHIDTDGLRALKD